MNWEKCDLSFVDDFFLFPTCFSGRKLSTNSEGRHIHAEDSSYLGGVFLLSAGDKIEVKLHHLSKQCHFSTDTDKTFFGVVKLSIA